MCRDAGRIPQRQRATRSHYERASTQFIEIVGRFNSAGVLDNIIEKPRSPFLASGVCVIITHM